MEKKLSKQEILRRAIKYINILEGILEYFKERAKETNAESEEGTFDEQYETTQIHTSGREKTLESSRPDAGNDLDEDDVGDQSIVSVESNISASS